MNIQHITSKDYPQMREILYEAIFVPPHEKPYSKDILDLPQIDKYVAQWDPQKDFGYMVMENCECIGAVWCRLFGEENKGYGFVDFDTPELTIALKPPYRNKGLGEKMMEKILKIAKKKGHKKISLSVDKGNPAIRFYKRLGFAIFEENEYDYIMTISITLKRKA